MKTPEAGACAVDGCDNPRRYKRTGYCEMHYGRQRRWGSVEDRPRAVPKRKKQDPDARFLKFVKWGEPSDFAPELGPCLLWTGADNGSGYGQFRWGERANGYAHRYAWEREHGPITDGLTVDHLCRVRRCVNAAHMELVEGVENYLRAVRIRTHCSQKHQYSAENTFYKPGRPGVRNCRICLENAKKSSGLRRTNAFKGVVDQRPRYDLALRDELVIEAVERRLTVTEAAERLGCAYKYMDKLVGREARARGVSSRRHHKGPIMFEGWTERKTRVAVRGRSDGVCERCDKSGATDMHHRKNRSQSGKWHPANIVHLCALCHVEITSEPDKSAESGFTVWSTEDPAVKPVLRRGVWVRLTDECDVIEEAAA